MLSSVTERRAACTETKTIDKYWYGNEISADSRMTLLLHCTLYLLATICIKASVMETIIAGSNYGILWM